MPTNIYDPASHALQAVGQAIVSSLNPAGSTVAQLNTVRAWVSQNPNGNLTEAIKNNTDPPGALAGNPVAQALVGNYGLTANDLNAFFTRYNVQNVVDQDGTNGTLNTGLQVIRAIDTQTNTQNLFVAGANPASEFVPVGARETSYFGGAITQGKALVDLLDSWSGQGINLNGATFVANSLGASALAMALPNTTVVPGEVIAFGGYGLDRNGLANGIAGAYPGFLSPIGFVDKADVTNFLSNVAAAQNSAGTVPITNFVNGSDWIPLFNDRPFGTLIYLQPAQNDVKDWLPSVADGLVQHGVGAYYRSLRLDVNNATSPILSIEAVAPQTIVSPPNLGTPARDSASLIVSNAGHSVTIKTGGTVSDIWLLQKNAGNVFTLEEFGRAILISNPGITDINAVQAGQVIYVPRRQTDGSVTYNYGGGASINTNATTGEYHMVVPNNSADGGFTIYQRSVDGDAGYVVRQTVTRLDGEITFATVGFQPTKDADITNLSTFTLNGTGSYDAATAVNGSLVAFEAEYNSARESFRASEIKSINDAAVDAATSGLDPTDLETFGFVFDKPLTASAQALITGLDPATQAATGAPVPQVQITFLSDGQSWRSLEVAGGSTFSTLRDDEGNVISATYSRELGAGVKLSEVYDASNTLLYSEKIEPVLTGANAGQLKETLIRPDGSGYIFQRGADGQEIADTRVRVAPYDQRLASTFSDVPSFIDAIKSGKPLPIVANGLRLLNDLDQLYTPGGSLPQLGTANTVAAGALSLYNLNNALKHGDAFDKLSATAFALNGTTNALIAANVISKTGAVVVKGVIAQLLTPELIADCAQDTRASGLFDSENRSAANDGAWEMAA